MSEDPWSDLAVPASGFAVNARRVNESIRWGFYWARDRDSHSLLILRHDVASSPKTRLPKLKGVELVVIPSESGSKPSLLLKLLDPKFRDIFYRLCTDIIASTSGCETESEAVATTVGRTWRWHHLLRGGTTGPLSVEEQKGLMGELLVLERYVLACFPPIDALSYWLGPLGKAQDFMIGNTGIESKATGALGSHEVKISSEYQLDDASIANLFLHLCVFDGADDTEQNSFTLTDVVERLRDCFVSSGDIALDRYNALLAAAGFRYEDDYTEFQWKGGERSIFAVTEGFPRLTPGNIPQEVKAVRYVLSLAECGRFAIAPDTLLEVLKAGIE
jgi:hypothetical protein